MYLDEATERATALLHDIAGATDPDGLMITRAELRDNGWLFFYSSAEFVRSRSFLHALGGALPILVPADAPATTITYEDISERAGEPIHPGA